MNRPAAFMLLALIVTAFPLQAHAKWDEYKPGPADPAEANVQDEPVGPVKVVSLKDIPLLPEYAGRPQSAGAAQYTGAAK